MFDSSINAVHDEVGVTILAIPGWNRNLGNSSLPADSCNDSLNILQPVIIMTAFENSKTYNKIMRCNKTICI